MQDYKPVVFVAGGEDGVCGGRHFKLRLIKGTWYATERVDGTDRFRCDNPTLGGIRGQVEALVNGDAR